MDIFFTEHIRDLSRKSETQGIFTFSAFLTPEEQSEILSLQKTLAPVMFFGGADGTERNKARFGDPAVLGYDEPWDIVCLQISPVNAKFADTLTHRDFLGALMNTGFCRNKIGDIIVRDACAYVFTDETAAAYIADNVKTVRHTSVRCRLCDKPPEGALFTVAPQRFISSSLRLDCVVAAVWRLSRAKAAELFAAKKIYVNSAICENAAHNIKDGDVVSVRGYGKFRFSKITGSTKKGKLSFEAELYR